MSDSPRFQLIARPSAAGRYEPVEFAVAVAAPDAANPFADLRCAATFTAPSGREIAVRGFCDAEDGSALRLRFCPQETGRYRYTLDCGDRSGEASFDGELAVAPSDEPGFVRVDPARPRHFIHDDGSHPFLAGKTAWMLGSSPLWRAFLDLCVLQGQNVVRFAVGGIDYGGSFFGCRWWALDAAGRPDRARFHLLQWRQLDRAIRYGAARGLLFAPCLVMGGHLRPADEYRIPDPAMEPYWDYAVARLAAFPGVLLWELFNEYTGQGEYQGYMADYLRRRDPYGRIITTSGLEAGDVPFPDAAWNEVAVPHFCTGSDRDLHDFYRAWAVRLRAIGKPLYIDETGRAIRSMRMYNYDGAHRRKQYWIWAMSGAYSNFHSKGGSYTDLTLEPGEESWPHLVRFWRGTHWYDLDPADAIVRARPDGSRAAYALAGPEEVVVYLYRDDEGAVEAGELTLDLPAGGAWWVHWYDPKTGCITDVDRLAEAASPQAIPTPQFRGDLAIHLVRVMR